jgi:hypothetical protein
MKSLTWVAISLFVMSTAIANANEIEGLRLGMTTAQVLKVAGEKGYTFSNPTKSGQNWTSYVLMKGGPVISFCGDAVASIGKSYDSNLHELANLVSQWTQNMGPPTEATATQQFMEGSPLSNLSYNWNGDDNVRRHLGFFQLGSRTAQVSYGYSYIKHPCR